MGTMGLTYEDLQAIDALIIKRIMPMDHRLLGVESDIKEIYFLIENLQVTNNEPDGAPA